MVYGPEWNKNANIQRRKPSAEPTLPKPSTTNFPQQGRYASATGERRKTNSHPEQRRKGLSGVQERPSKRTPTVTAINDAGTPLISSRGHVTRTEAYEESRAPPKRYSELLSKYHSAQNPQCKVTHTDRTPAPQQKIQ